MALITVRYWAAAKDAAGVAEEPVEAETLAAALADISSRRGPKLTTVLGRCAFLVDEQPVGRRDPAVVPLREGALVEVLPPFAGG